MARIVGIGGGVVGMVTGALLARDGHQVTLCERDEAGPPDDPRRAWDDWERRGVNQFRLLHLFQPGFHQVARDGCPELLAAAEDAGALRMNVVAEVPEQVSGGPRPGDDRFDFVTGRRSVMEAACARAVAGVEGLVVRRGTAVVGLFGTTQSSGGVPHVEGVRLESGETLPADLVLDLGGRRSGVPRMLGDLGAGPVHEEAEDLGFAYYGRHFRSADGTLPPAMGPFLIHYGSVSVLTLPADNGTWGVGIITVGADAELRGLRDPERWTAAMGTFALQAHWADGAPIDDVAYMTKLEDRRRSLVVDGSPVATGVVTVGDAWACTNPSLGRGVGIGARHGRALRDLLREGSLDDPTAFSLAWDDRTTAEVGEWFDATLAYDRHRLAEASAAVEGHGYETDDELWRRLRALEFAAGSDPDLFRAQISIAGVLRPPSAVFADAAVAAKVDAIGDTWKDQEALGPTREQLVAIAND